MASTQKQEVSKYRMNKFKSFFRFVDVNKDGFIGVDDYEMMATNMARLSNTSEQETADIRKQLLKIWDIVSGGRSTEVKMTIAEAVEGSIIFHSTASQEKIIELNNTFFHQAFDIIDRNKDNLISREELAIYYKSHGIPDETFIHNVFDLIDTNKNGVISRTEFVKASTGFWCSDDPENGFAFIYDPPK